MGIFRGSSSTSLGDTPQNQIKGGKKAAPAPPEGRIFKMGQGSSTPSSAQVIWRIRKEEALLILKRARDVATFRKALDRVVGEKAEIVALFSRRPLRRKRSCLPCAWYWIDWPFRGPARLFTRIGGVKTAVIQMAETDAARLLQPSLQGEVGQCTAH